MDALFYGIQYIFEFIFQFLPAIGRSTNILFILIGFVANFIWIWYMIKYKSRKHFHHAENH